MRPRETTNEQTEINFESKHGKFLKEILAFYIPLLLKLPQLRADKKFMEVTVKATGDNGVDDVVTRSDEWMQGEIKKAIQKLHPDWQFWGEEGEDTNVDKTQKNGYLLITDPIEGTNNFRAGDNEHWGSVAAVVDQITQEPVIGIIAQPMTRHLFVGVKGEGAFEIIYDENGDFTQISLLKLKPPQHNKYTYNNSPHFNQKLRDRVKKFQALGEIQHVPGDATPLQKSRLDVILENDGEKAHFVDVECGALEPMLYPGVIMFKTNIEMAAVFPIAQEIGAKVTDANGNGWSPELNTLIFGRTEKDWEKLKKIYDETI